MNLHTACHLNLSRKQSCFRSYDFAACRLFVRAAQLTCIFRRPCKSYRQRSIKRHRRLNKMTLPPQHVGRCSQHDDAKLNNRPARTSSTVLRAQPFRLRRKKLSPPSPTLSSPLRLLAGASCPSVQFARASDTKTAPDGEPSSAAWERLNFCSLLT
jgi:hypothetical protein